MAIIKHVAKGEIRILSIDEVRLVDGVALDQCYREIVEVLDKTEESCAVLHFGRVTFMSSSALSMLVRVAKKCNEYKIALRLCNIAGELRTVFKITALDKKFAIHDDVVDAIEGFKKAGQLSFKRKPPQVHDVPPKA